MKVPAELNGRPVFDIEPLAHSLQNRCPILLLIPHEIMKFSPRLAPDC